ncbi:MAG: argininosuccinate lyase [Cyclobacteriaceae bacterium]
MKLWQKDASIDQFFERFTIGKDPELDLYLAHYDVLGSEAHVEMLATVGLLTGDERDQLLEGLNEIKKIIAEGDFVIEAGIEDCHSQIEMMLTAKLGDVGKKVHSGRSRNDQVLTALKLFTLAEIEAIAEEINQLFITLIAKSEESKDKLMPGYTHMQIAMPSSFGMWFGAYAESLIDDLTLLKAAHEIVNKNPLGSAAGYGSSFPLDRKLTTKLMGFDQPNVNAVYAQMTRGKMEKTTAFAISGIAATLSKFAMDVCLYSGQDYGFLKIEKQYTTGSSIMPHKSNPDGFELVRGKCNKLQALPYELNLILGNLPSGYHRDLQVLKEQFVPSIFLLKDCVRLTRLMVEGMTVADNLLDDPKYDMMFSVEIVNQLVEKGIPFRDAYHQVSGSIKDGSYEPDRNLDHKHLGSLGNLGNEDIVKSFENVMSYFK